MQRDRSFHDMIQDKWATGKFVCVGLDSDYAQLPECVKRDEVAKSIYDFNAAIIEATNHLVCAYKINTAFYEARGESGWHAILETCKDIILLAKDVPIILDFKRADIGNTNAGYVTAAFEWLKADAVTVSPYLGAEALQPFLNRAEKGIFILCRTSNPGASEFQDLPQHDGRPLYQHVAERVTKHWNHNLNCGLVVGATYPGEMRIVRTIAEHLPFLVPGVGAQGGDVAKVIGAGLNPRREGLIINSSRAIIFASKGKDFAEAARRETQALHAHIEAARLAYR